LAKSLVFVKYSEGWTTFEVEIIHLFTYIPNILFNMIKRLLGTVLLSALVLAGLSAQRSASATALNFLRANPTQFGLTTADVSDVKITDEYVSEQMGLTHVWVQQQHQGTPVFNGLFGLHVTKEDKVLHLDHRFVPALNEKVNTTIPSLSAAKALELALGGLDFNQPQTPRLNEKINERNFIFDKGTVSRSNIPVSACFHVSKDGQTVRLAWTMTIDQINTSDIWSIRIDAQTGALLDRINQTVYCNAGHVHRDGEFCQDAVTSMEGALPFLNAAESYNVFALPTESPAHGSRVVVTDPAHPVASPFGWLDVNGVAGNEYTYTRGNNVWAYNDLANDNTGSEAESFSGGSTTTFNAPFDPAAEPEANLGAATVNLFYMNNMMHDIAYVYGFNEVAGNFQTNNYSKGGLGGDEVQAEALDNGGTDNANFATPSDGGKPRMQMFKWSRSGGNIVNVIAPDEVAGTYFGQAASGWGGQITQTPITGEVVVVENSAGTTFGCEPPLNDVSGKIVIIDRGSCEFGVKALNVEQAGAIGCIICNFAASTVGMGAGAVGGEVTIPVLMLSSTTCSLLRAYAGAGLKITLAQPAVSGPDFLDGDFDNGIIAHEYGHGISNRLTGGPSQSNCLSNDEQMGEGWSDFFSLVTTVKAGDVPQQKRGVGTYVQRQPNDGTGIRRYPYSTDMTISPLTFSDVAQNTGVHALGEVWSNMLWDLYWAMVDKYGFDIDWHNTNSGNGRAIQLVMDGMKLQPCNPGFGDGRNAIVLADINRYGGADTCLISKVFARRGLGKFASQGSNTSATDGVENFEPIELCVRELKIQKTTTTPTIEAGGVANFSIKVTNHKGQDATNVVVSDIVPQGLTVVAASTSGVVNGNTITWDLGTMAQAQVITLTYSAQADMNGSLRLYRDELEDEPNGLDWYEENSTAGGVNLGLQSTFKVTGQSAWKCDNVAATMQTALVKATPLPITGNKPVLRFWNRFLVEDGNDASFLEYRLSENEPWKLFNKNLGFRNGYTDPVSYSTLATPFLYGYSGNSNGWKHSYLDMKALSGADISLRFRFVSNATTNFDGWYIDDLELLEMVNYDTEACVTSAQGDQNCSRVTEGGVIVNPATSGTDDLVGNNALRMKIQPNPATDMVYLTINQALAGRSLLSVLSTEGRVVAQRNLLNINKGESVAIDVNVLPAGVYTIRLESTQGVLVEKLVVR
jgi:uncharacterized repeat protein (TIGR01451 family)